ncbi:hypothetical protein M8J75_006975 [Diaphorina citri]|nr:hypothetical protein M8J75_006975 [Diaphorina citri]
MTKKNSSYPVVNSSTEDMIQVGEKDGAKSGNSAVDPSVQTFCRFFFVLLFILAVVGIILKKFEIIT